MSNPSRRLIAIAVALAGALLAWFLWTRPAAQSDGGEGKAIATADPSGLRAKRAIDGEVEDDTTAAGAARRPWNDNGVTIRGRVHDEHDQPVVGAKVCASVQTQDAPAAMRRSPKCTESRAQGAYVLEGVAPVRIVVSASAATFIPGQHRPTPKRRWIEPTPGAALGGIDIELRSGGVEIRGVVKDISGGTVEGAQVSVGGNRWSGGGLATTLADAEGAFSLWVAPGQTSVSASAEGYTEGSEQGSAPGYTFEVLLTPESVVGGRVVDAATGAVVADARVEVEGERWGGSQIAFTDAEGRFRIDRLEPGRYTATATTADRYGVSNESRQVGLGQAIDDVEIRVFPSASIAGQVVVAGDPQVPCDDATVSLHGKTTKHTAWKTGDREGHVEVQGLPPDSYDLDVSCDGFVAKPKYDVVELAEQPVTGLVWEVEQGLTLAGIVVDADGKPVKDARVTAMPTGGAARAKQTRAWGAPTGADGRFELDGLLAATYEVTANHDDHMSAEQPLTHALAPGQAPELRLVLEVGGTVRGRVVDAKRRPVPGAQVRTAGKRWGGGSASTGDDGTFELKNVRPGDHRVSAQSSGWSPLRAPGSSDDDVQGVAVTVRAGAVVEVELLVEEQFGTIRGRVVDADGGPVDDAFVSYSRESDSAKQAGNRARQMVRWSGWIEAPVLTDAGGEFELTQIPEGKHTLIAQRKGGGEGTIEHIESGSTGVVIRLAEGARLAGRVVIAAGGVPSRFTISASDEAQGVERSEFFHNTQGAWQVSDLPPGKYVVSVSATEGAADTTVTLAAAATKDDIELKLTPRVDVTGTVVDLDTGAPVPGMMVTIAPLKGQSSFSFFEPGEQEHVSDDAGAFTVRGAPTGPVRITVMGRDFFANSGNGYGWSNIRANIPAGEKTHQLAPLRLVAQRVKGRERGGDLGFSVKETAPDQEPEDTPLQVAVIRPGGPAAKTDLKLGDVIVEVDGTDVTGDNRYLYNGKLRVNEGDSISLGLADGRSVTIVAGKPP